MQETAQLWIYMKKGQPWAVVSTSTYVDPIFHQHFLYIYTLFALASLTRADIEYGLNVLKVYAKAHSMQGLMAYTNVDSVEGVLLKFGANTEFTFTYIPID